MNRQTLKRTLATVLLALLAACSSLPPPPESSQEDGAQVASPRDDRSDQQYFELKDPDERQQVVLFALGLLDTAYRFGGRNPDAGLDCSGMVSYVVEQVSGQKLPHNAARIAAITRPISTDDLHPGDLVFFNTSRRQHSHMGIYLGNGRFVHAPSSKGRVRVERMDNPYFSRRLDGVRALASDG